MLTDWQEVAVKNKILLYKSIVRPIRYYGSSRKCSINLVQLISSQKFFNCCQTLHGMWADISQQQHSWCIRGLLDENQKTPQQSATSFPRNRHPHWKQQCFKRKTWPVISLKKKKRICDLNDNEGDVKGKYQWIFPPHVALLFVRSIHRINILIVNKVTNNFVCPTYFKGNAWKCIPTLQYYINVNILMRMLLLHKLYFVNTDKAAVVPAKE